MADALLRLAAAQRLRDLSGTQAESWAKRFHLAAEGARWMSLSPMATQGVRPDTRLVQAPQMLMAGWQGIGSTSPSPARPEDDRGAEAVRAMSGSKGKARRQRPSSRAPQALPMGAFLAAILFALAAGGGTWFALHPASINPTIASLSGHLWDSSAPKHLPLELADAPVNGDKMPGRRVAQAREKSVVREHLESRWPITPAVTIAIVLLVLAALGMTGLMLVRKVRRRS